MIKKQKAAEAKKPIDDADHLSDLALYWPLHWIYHEQKCKPRSCVHMLLIIKYVACEFFCGGVWSAPNVCIEKARVCLVKVLGGFPPRPLGTSDKPGTLGHPRHTPGRPGPPSTIDFQRFPFGEMTWARSLQDSIGIGGIVFQKLWGGFYRWCLVDVRRNVTSAKLLYTWLSFNFSFNEMNTIGHHGLWFWLGWNSLRRNEHEPFVQTLFFFCTTILNSFRNYGNDESLFDLISDL